MSAHAFALAAIDRRTFFEQTLAYGMAHHLLADPHLDKMIESGAKGLVQIANFFGTAYLQTNLEVAAVRMNHLISLYLQETTEGDLNRAALLLRDQPLLSLSKGGFDMLRRLCAMPTHSHLLRTPATDEDIKAFLEEHSHRSPYTLETYREAYSAGQQIQRQIDFARWVAKHLGATAEDYEHHAAEQLIHSAMLVWFVGTEVNAFPSKVELIRLIAALRKKTFKPDLERFRQVMTHAPEDFRAMATSMMDSFSGETLALLRDGAIPPTEFIHGRHAAMFYLRESLEEEAGHADELVSKEWRRITRGHADAETLATLFLRLATGASPKTCLLQREARVLIHQYRTAGFDDAAVLQFIDEHAPYEQRLALTELWEKDLRQDAEVYLSDTTQDDTHMERALKYLKQTCNATWKGRS